MSQQRANWTIPLGIVFGVVVGVVLSKVLDRVPGPVFADGAAGAGAVNARTENLRDAARRIAPSVVAITSLERVRFREGGGLRFDRGGMPFYVPPRLKEGLQPRGAGSGFIFDAVNGYIMTNNHVVAEGESFIVRLSDKRQLEAKLVGADPQTDVAVLKIEPENLTAAVLGDSNSVEVPDPVLAVGNPFGLLEQTVTSGVISAKGRRGLNLTAYEDFLQTDAAINVGNSGGPLVNDRGEVIGMNTAIFSRTGGYQGIGFAIPINQARSIATKLIKNGTVTRGWLGVETKDLSANELKRMKLENGVSVEAIYLGGPGRQGGLQPGDILTEINGKPVNGSGEIRDAVADMEPGSSLEVKVLRNNETKTLSLKIGTQPKDFSAR